MGDRILYTKVSNGGGVDGRDPTYKGGHVSVASFDKRDVKKDGWSTVHMEAVDTLELLRLAKNKLTVVDILILEHYFAGTL